MKKMLCLLLLLSLMGLLLAACGSSAQSPEVTAEPSATPEPTKPPYLEFPDGSHHDYDEKRLDLSWLSHEDVATVAELLTQMPKLKRVELGADNIRTAEEAAAALAEEADETQPSPTPQPAADGEENTPAIPERLEWADIRLLQEAAPRAEFSYRFRFYGKDFTLQDKAMDLNHRTMDDEGAAVREILPCMKHCAYLDMDFCGVSNEAMASIRDDFPQMEVVWRIWFGDQDRCSVRTNVERILASEPGFKLLDENTEALKYCTKVKYLDLGHMPDLHDWSFLGYMTDLEVAVISIGGWDDLSCLGNCTHLEYLEMCSRSTRGPLDISFLANLKELKHLDICYLKDDLVGYEVLEDMTQLERLWIGRFTYLPEDFVEGLQEKLPNTVVNTTSETGCLGAWRYEPDGVNANERYALLCRQFDYGNFNNVCALYYNDPLYYPHD